MFENYLCINGMSKECRCETCLNSRFIISENGCYTTCGLSLPKAIECIMDIDDNKIP